MADMIDETLLSRLGEIIANQMGLHFPRERWSDLARAMTKAASAQGFSDGEAYVRHLLGSPLSESQIDTLAAHLTVGETHFFRDERLFQVLEEKVLPELIAQQRFQNRRLCIWSAGCATGEEPYSLAILLSRLIPDLTAWQLSIIGTDINRRFLEKAEQGIYTQWSFRTVPPGIRESFFRSKGTEFELVTAIRKMVGFSYLNLARSAFPPCSSVPDGVDIVICRNVLMYFSPDRQEHAVESFCRTLSEGGWLIVSPAEASIITHPNLSAINFPGAVLFRKCATPSTRAKGFPFVFPIPVCEPPAPVSSPQEPLLWWPTPEDNEETTASVYAQPAPAPEPMPRPNTGPHEEARRLYDEGRYGEVADRLWSWLSDDRPEDGDTAAAMALLTRAFANLGRLDAALEWSERALAMEKLNPEQHYLHGTILQELGRVDDAVTAHTRAVFLEPDLVVAHFALGNLARLRGKPRESDRHYRVALSILSRYEADQAVPSSDGMTAGRLAEIILAITDKESSYDKA